MSPWKHKYALLVRREFWEHRSLLIAPLTAAALVLLVVLFGRARPGHGFIIDVPLPEVLRELVARHGLAGAAEMTLVGTMVFIGVIAAIAVLLFLLDALYAERKDRSILFWKSMPVSDTETVLAKLTVGLVVVPLGTMLLALAMQPLMGAILLLRFEVLREFMRPELVGGWLSALGAMLGIWLFSVLWYLPMAAYLLLISVLARRAPMTVAVVPLVLASLFERWLLGRSDSLVGYRLMPWNYGAEALLGPDRDYTDAFLNPDLWTGLAAGIVMVYIVIRLRRYRDDT